MITQRLKTIAVPLLAIAIVIGGILIAPALADAQNAYSAGTYGACEYNSCGITLGADATAVIDVTPSAGSTSCSVAKADVQVLTDSSTGYTLSITDSDTDTTLKNGGSGTIAATSGTAASPSTLTTNTWGYRVNSISGFGAGPTSPLASGAIPAVTFAALPSSAGTPDTIATQATPSNPSTITSVWYGVCVNASIPNGAYSDAVTYTVVVN